MSKSQNRRNSIEGYEKLKTVGKGKAQLNQVILHKLLRKQKVNLPEIRT